MAWFEGVVAKESLFAELCTKIESTNLYTIQYTNTATPGSEWKYYKATDAAGTLIGLRAMYMNQTGNYTAGTANTYSHIRVHVAQSVDGASGTATNVSTSRVFFWDNSGVTAGTLVQYWMSVLPTAIILVLRGDPAQPAAKQGYVFAGRMNPFYTETDPNACATVFGHSGVVNQETPVVTTTWTVQPKGICYTLKNYAGTTNLPNYYFTTIYDGALKSEAGDFQLLSAYFFTGNAGLRGEVHPNLKMGDRVNTNMANYDEVTIGADTYKYFKFDYGAGETGNISSFSSAGIILKKA